MSKLSLDNFDTLDRINSQMAFGLRFTERSERKSVCSLNLDKFRVSVKMLTIKVVAKDIKVL